MKNYITTSRLFLLLIVSLFASALSQKQPVEQTQSTQEEIIPYKVSEIPYNLEETRAYLTKLNEEIISVEELAKSEKELELVNKSYQVLKKQTDSLGLEDEYSTTLYEFRQKWLSQEQKVNDWTSIVTSRTEELEEAKNDILYKKDIWKRTYELAKKEKAPSTLINSIRDLTNSINKLEKGLTSKVNSSLSLQTKLSEQSVAIKIMLGELEELLKEKERGVFTQNESRIWEAFSVAQDSTTITVQFSKIWESYLRTSREFIRNNKDRIILDFILFLFSLLMIYTLRSFGKKLEEKEPDYRVELAFKLLERPISTTFLLYLLIAVIHYEDAPAIIFSILRILVVFPLLRILIHIVNPVLRIPLIYLCGLIIVQQFMITAGSPTPLERALLIIISSLSIAGLTWLILKKIPERAFKELKTITRVNSISKLAILIIAIGLVGNLLGYVMLDFVIINGVLNSSYGIILLLTAEIAFIALMILSLKIKPLQKINVVRNQADTIKITIIKIIKFIVFIWSLNIIARNFFVQDEIIIWIEESMAKVWKIGNLNISIGHILLFFVSIWLAVQISRLVRFILEGDVLPRLNLARGVPGAISAITRYLIIAFGFLVALVTAGIDLNSFTLLAGALGVGIGFGLQDLVNNFISGLILIFERPIQVGDAVQVEELSGRVKQIGIRSSIIKTWEGAEVIVPNGSLISKKLINWTMSDQLRRIEIKIGVAFGSDVNLVMETLINCAAENEKILTYPRPYVLFNDHGESSLEFELRCWTSDYPNWVEIRSELRVKIDTIFKEKDIKIPYPQRELHINSENDNQGKETLNGNKPK